MLGGSSWIDASDAAYRTLDGSLLVELDDKILGGGTPANWQCASFPTTTQAPDIDTDTGIVSFDGASSGIVCTDATLLGWFNAASGTDDVTIMSLCKQRSIVANASVGQYAQSTLIRYGGLRVHDANKFGIARRVLTLPTAGGIADTNWHAWAGRINGASSQLTIDGVVRISGTLATTAITPTHFCVGFHKTNSGDVDFAPMDWIEQVIFVGVATDEQEAGVRAYWAAKHGLTS